MAGIRGSASQSSATSETSGRLGRSPVVLAFRLALPVVLLIYSVAFFRSISVLRPDSRYYPQIMIALLVPLLLLQVVADVREWAAEARPHGAMSVIGAWWPTAFVASWTVAFILGINWIGFYEAIIPYVAGLLPGLGVRRPALILAFTAGAFVGMYLLFGVVLGVRVPTGLLGL